MLIKSNSEFNIMIDDNEKPILIDFPQMVSSSHSEAEKYPMFSLFRRTNFTERSFCCLEIASLIAMSSACASSSNGASISRANRILHSTMSCKDYLVL